MNRRFLLVFALLTAFALSAASVALVVRDGLLPGGGNGRRPWDVRAILRDSLQEMLASDETRAMLEDMFPNIAIDKEALVKDILSTLATSPEARQILRDALYTPEARQAFADALRSPEAERAMREILASPQIKKTVTDLVREFMKQGY